MVRRPPHAHSDHRFRSEADQAFHAKPITRARVTGLVFATSTASVVGQIRGAFPDGFRLAELDAVGVVHEPLADGVGKRRVADDGVPVLGLELAGDDGRARVVAVIEQFEQILAVLRGEGLEAKVVQLCGAAHKSTNGEPAEMWSPCRAAAGQN